MIKLRKKWKNNINKIIKNKKQMKNNKKQMKNI
jgi:hypothetical protein